MGFSDCGERVVAELQGAMVEQHRVDARTPGLTIAFMECRPAGAMLRLSP